jgi:hypothetical protein
MRSWLNGAGLAAMMLGCGGAEPAASDPPDDIEIAAPSAGTDRDLPGAGSGFVDAPSVRFRESAVNGAPQLNCRQALREITFDDARAFGIDVDGDRAALEQTWSRGAFVSDDPVRSPMLHVRAQIERVWMVEQTPLRADIASGRCPATVRYDVLVQLYTDDGALSGAFISQNPATRAGEMFVPVLQAVADLRNFSGNMPVSWDSSAGAFGAADVAVLIGDPATGELYPAGSEDFYFLPHAWGPSGGVCDDAGCSYEAGHFRAEMSDGIRTLGFKTFQEFLADASSRIREPDVATLAEFVDTMGPYKPSVRVSVTAASAEAAQVQVDVRVNGVDRAPVVLDLLHDDSWLAEGWVGAKLDVGAVLEGTPVEIGVTDIDQLGDVWSEPEVGGCPLTTSHDHCVGPGCTARNTLLVVAAGCNPIVF